MRPACLALIMTAALLLGGLPGALGAATPVQWVIGAGSPPDWTLTVSGDADGPVAPPFQWITVVRNMTGNPWSLSVDGWNLNATTNWNLGNVLNLTMDMRGQFIGTYFSGIATRKSPASMNVYALGDFNFAWYGMPRVKDVRINGIPHAFVQNDTSALWTLYVDPPVGTQVVTVIFGNAPAPGKATNTFDFTDVSNLLLVALGMVIMIGAIVFVLALITNSIGGFDRGRKP